jgi:hypothetical protein
MTLEINHQRGAQAAQLLLEHHHSTGIHGVEIMPEDYPPVGVERGSLLHVLFLTLTVAIDYQRDATTLWRNARKTFEDPETRYLFDPHEVAQTSENIIIQDMQKYQLSKKPRKDAGIWRRISVGFFEKWHGSPVEFLEECDWDALVVLARLRSEQRYQNSKFKDTFPFLRGNKIGPLWLRILRDSVGFDQIRNLDRIPIPVDIHIARATLCLGVLQGRYSGPIEGLYDFIRQSWFECTRDVVHDSKPVIPLDVDEPLWNLSRLGCTHRGDTVARCPLYNRCEMTSSCVYGKVSIRNNRLELDT